MGKEGKGEALHRGCYHCNRFVADWLCCSSNSASTFTHIHTPAHLDPPPYPYAFAPVWRDIHAYGYARTNLDARANA